MKPEKANSTPAKASTPFALEPLDKCVWIDIHAFVDELESGGKLKADDADTLRCQYIDTKDERIAYRFHAAKRQATENSTKTAAIDSFLRHVRSLLTAQ